MVLVGNPGDEYYAPVLKEHTDDCEGQKLVEAASNKACRVSGAAQDEQLPLAVPGERSIDHHQAENARTETVQNLTLSVLTGEKPQISYNRSLSEYRYI